MRTVPIFIFCAAGAVVLYSGLLFREWQLKTELDEMVAKDLKELIKLDSFEGKNPRYQEQLAKVKNESEAYSTKEKTVQYQLATMSPCNPRITSCTYF